MNVFRLIVFLLIAFVPAVFGGLFGPGDWYREIAKPSWTPPGWLFGPVWTLLYATIGVAGYLAFGRSEGRQRTLAFGVYGLQLLLNALWSWLFFGLENPGLAFVDIAFLLVLIVANIALFLPIRRAAGLLLVPYALWVAFATALNFSIWRMNA
jgi:tryptophan-rich sensory protein